MYYPGLGLVEVLILTLACGIMPVTGALIALLVARARQMKRTGE